MSDKIYNYSFPPQVGFPFEQIAENSGTDPNDFLIELVSRYVDRVLELRSEIQKGIDAMEDGRYVTISNQEEANELKDRITQNGKRELEKKMLRNS